MGEDAIELVTDEVDEVSAVETTIDLTEAGLGTEQPVEAYLSDDPVESAETAAHAEGDAPEVDPAAAVEEEHDPAENEPPSRRPARKARGRASVPSWDEIMFGGPSD